MKRKREETNKLSIFKDSREKYYGTAIVKAAKKNHTEIVKVLLEEGAEPNDADYEDAPQFDCLYYAVLNNNLEIVKLLFEYNYDISKVDWNNVGANGDKKIHASNPLYMAVKNDHIEIAVELLNNRYPCDFMNDIVPKTALTVAASRGHLELVKLMLRNAKEDECSQIVKKIKLEDSVEEMNQTAINSVIINEQEVNAIGVDNTDLVNFD